MQPLRSRLSVTSSHIVLTEPVPDVLEAIGWTGGESITDGRTFLHYFRTTRDGRIALRLGRRAARVRRAARRPRSRSTPPVIEETTARTSSTASRRSRGGAITHAWGGPIDVSPSHLPQIGTLADAPVHYAFGFTGNGVGPSHLAGRSWPGSRSAPATATAGSRSSTRAASCRRSRSRGLGGMIVRRAFLRAERLHGAGRRPDPLTRAVCAAPRALGIHVSR